VRNVGNVDQDRADFGRHMQLSTGKLLLGERRTRKSPASGDTFR
jgi:hypothetical protein